MNKNFKKFTKSPKIPLSPECQDERKQDNEQDKEKNHPIGSRTSLIFFSLHIKKYILSRDAD